MRPPGSLPEDDAAEIFSDWTAPRRRGAVPSFLFSLAAHAMVVAVAWQVNPRPSATDFNAPTVEQLLAENERRVVWYSPKAELPEVKPVEPKASPAEAETPRYRLPQRVNADDPNPQSSRQMIVSDAPDVEIRQDLDLPNMLSWKAPEVERPRFQLEQPKLIAPSEQTMAAITPPKVETQSDQPQVDASKFNELSKLRFQREQKLDAPDPQRQALAAEAAPELALNAQAPALDPAQFEGTTRLRYQGRRQTSPNPSPSRQALTPGEAPVISTTPTTRAGVNPADYQRQTSRLRYQAGSGTPQQAAPQAQALGANGLPAPVVTNAPDSGPGVNAADFQQISKLRYQGPAGSRPAGPGTGPRAIGDLTGGPAPSVSSATSNGAANEQIARAAAALNRLEGPGAPPPSLGAPGGDQSGGTGGDENLVVAGVNPGNRIPNELPKGRRRGSFSAGPDATANGGKTGSAGSDSARLRVPGLAVEGPNNATQRSSLPGQRPADDLNAMLRRGSLRNAPPPPPELEIVWDPRKIDVDNPFVGRPVYKTAINMPNVTSYRGDWIIQFAEYDEAASKKRRGAPTEDIEDRASARPDGIEPPYPKIKVDPKYVADAARDLIEGEVIVYGIIQESGSITNITLLKSVDDLLDVSAQEALAKWKFEPARKDGKAVAVEALVRIPFRLDPSVKVRY